MRQQSVQVGKASAFLNNEMSPGLLNPVPEIVENGPTFGQFSTYKYPREASAQIDHS